MIVFSEEKNGTQSIFSKKVIDDYGNEISKRIVRMPMYQKEQNEFPYFILYYDNMEVVHEFYEYLNHDLSDSPLTSRYKAAFSLRLLFCFLSLKNIEVEDLDEGMCSELIRFLKGLSLNLEDSEFTSQRSNKTINNYLATYRDFFTQRDINCQALSKKKI